MKLQASKDVAAALELALDAGDFEAAYGVLIAVRFGKTVVTPWLEALIVRCYRCEVSKVRGLSCELAVLSDLALVRDVHVKSDWVASTDRNSGNETWFASILLIEACIKKEISLSEMLRRVTPESWFVAANRIDEALRKPLADYILRRLRGGVFALKGLSRPALDYTLSPVEHSSYTLRSVDEADLNESRFTPQDSFENLFREDDFDEKQKRLRTNSEAFFTQLSDSDARIFVERLTIEDVALLIHQEPSFLIQVVEIFEEVSRSELAWLRNLALSAANLLSGDMPERAASLIHKAVESKGFVSYDLGDSLTLEHKAVWSCQPSTAIIQYWRRRILSCGNDESLAMEVLAAERFGAKGFIKDFVGELSDSTLPLDKAYAITIAGFSSQIDELVSVIDAHIDDVGITGVAAKKAKADHQAMTWATKWVSELCSAQTPEQFWRSLIILKTCLDARGAAEPLKDTEWAHYGPLYQRVRESSIKEINKARKKTLVGQEVPDPIFLAG
ncbi:hypothetical protein [Pontibacterium sp.]|uniref:hypothetical protein n=1 Tax=Pontibacterium sp. TaxID=2036026 RepID=UPI0035596D12